MSISRVTSPRESLIGLPASRHSAYANSSKRALKALTQYMRISLRLYAGSFCIAGSAASASTMPRSTSEAEPSETWQMTSFVYLSVTSSRLEVVDASSPTKMGHTGLMLPLTSGSVATGPCRLVGGPLAAFAGAGAGLGASAGAFHAARSARRLLTTSLSSTLSSRSEEAYEIGMSTRWTAGVVRHVWSSEGRSSVRCSRWPTAPYELAYCTKLGLV